MSHVYFYVIEWNDGSGTTSGLVFNTCAALAFADVEVMIRPIIDGKPCDFGTIVDFKKVE